MLGGLHKQASVRSTSRSTTPLATPRASEPSATHKNWHRPTPSMRRTPRTGAQNKDSPPGEGVETSASASRSTSPGPNGSLTSIQNGSSKQGDQEKEDKTPRSLIARLRNMKILGLDPSPEILAISMVYFVQGILGLARLAVSFFFKDTLKVEPAEVAIFTSFAGLPWMIKPLYGFISDSLPLFGYRRRSYLVLTGLIGACAWATMATFVEDPRAAAACLLLGSLSTAASDVLVDSIVVERARGAPQATAGSLQSLCWGSSAIGGVVSAYWSGFLVEEYGARFCFGITALFPLIVSCSALLIDEKRIVPSPKKSSTGSTSRRSSSTAELGLVPLDGHNPGMGKAESGSGGPVFTGSRRSHDLKDPDLESDPLLGGTANGGYASTAYDSAGGATVQSHGLAGSAAEKARALWAAVTRREILLPTIFVFLYNGTPSYESALFYFETNKLGFTPEFLGRVRLVGSLASLAGVALYNGALKQVPLRTVLWWSMILGTALGSTQLILVSRANLALGLSDQLFVLGDSVILTVLGQASFMPVLVLAARLCPEGVEATLFATLMSILNGGAFMGSALGAGLTKLLGVTSNNFDNLFTLVLICNLAQMAPAPFLGLLPATLDTEKEENGKDDDNNRPGGSGKGGSDNGSKEGRALSKNSSLGIQTRATAAAAQKERRDGNDSPLGSNRV